MKTSAGRRIWNWLKNKFSRFGKRADELINKIIDKGGDKLINELERMVDPIL